MTSEVVAKTGMDKSARSLLWLFLALLYYAFLLSVAGGLFGPVQHGLVFNDMLIHLLRARVDVDPASIGDEGYVRDGVTYAYFGIGPALVRLIVLPLPGFAATDFTRVACLAAVSLMALFKLLTAMTIARRVGLERAPALLSLMLAAILLSGAQIEFLRPSIFQEAALWADACAATFVYLVVRGWLDGFSLRLLTGMAVAAGLCLLVRVSTALGLYLVFGALSLLVWWRQRRFHVLPVLILIVCVALTAAINTARWGNPLVFVDLSKALILARFPDRLSHLHEYGEFNPIRIAYGLSYYLAPFWALSDGAGQLWWQAFQERVTDSAELPPASFFISDPFWVGLAVFGLITLLNPDRLPKREWLLAALPGLLVPIALILMLIDLTFRYRLEFYPFLELCAFAGFARLLAVSSRRAELWFGAGAIGGIAAAQAMWVLYMLSPFGPAAMVLDGLPVGTFYRSLFP